jgi:S-phase kinase-associated protein 1
MENISLMAKDGAIRVVSIGVAKMALTLKDMIENSGQQSSDESKPVPLLNISSHILDKVIEWLQHHCDDPNEEIDSEGEDNYDMKRTNDLSEWDREFVQVDHKTLFDLIFAANFLHIKGLLDIGCKAAAELIKDKSAEEVRDLWNIKCDLTPEEEKKLKMQNEWTNMSEDE